MERKELENLLIDKFDFYRDCYTWCNFLANMESDFGQLRQLEEKKKIDEKDTETLKNLESLGKKIKKVNKNFARLEFEASAQIETCMLTHLVRSILTSEELSVWHNILKQHLNEKTIDDVNQMRAEQLEITDENHWSIVNALTNHLVDKNDPENKEYFELVDRLGQLIAKKCNPLFQLK